jgi:serine/threonine protein kinase
MPHVLWDRPRFHTTTDIPEECIREDTLFKIKGAGKLESKHFILSRGVIYYTNSEDDKELRGQLDLSYVFVEFIDAIEMLDQELDNSAEDDPQDVDASGDPVMFAVQQTKAFGGEDAMRRKSVGSRLGIAGLKINSNEFIEPHSHHKLQASAKHIENNQVDNQFLHSVMMKQKPKTMRRLSKVNELIKGEEMFQVDHIADEHMPMMIIRFTIGNKFTEIGTYDREVFQAWRSILKFYCLQTNFLNDYHVEQIIADKEHSKVYLVQHLHGKNKYTAKTISKNLLANDEAVVEKVRHELSIYKRMHHHNIVKLYEVFEDHLAVSLVFEYLSGPTIEQVSKAGFRFRNRDLICFLRECLDVIKYLHERGVVHRDINPLTVLLRSHGKVSPLNPPVFIGLSKSLVLHSRPLTVEDVVCGRYGYVAPEVVRAQQTEDISGVDLFKVDVYGVGLLLYILMSELDVHSTSLTSTSSKIRSFSQDAYALPFNHNFDRYNNELKSVVKSMISLNPRERPTVDELLALPFLSEQIIREYQLKEEKRTKEMFGQIAENSDSSDDTPKSNLKKESIEVSKPKNRRLTAPAYMHGLKFIQHGFIPQCGIVEKSPEHQEEEIKDQRLFHHSQRNIRVNYDIFQQQLATKNTILQDDRPNAAQEDLVRNVQNLDLNNSHINTKNANAEFESLQDADIPEEGGVKMIKSSVYAQGVTIRQPGPQPHAISPLHNNPLEKALTSKVPS